MGRRGLRSQRRLAVDDVSRGGPLAMNGTLHMGHFARFPNVHDDAALAEAMPAGVEVYAATVSAGELLYVPQAAIHAARSLEPTVMVVHNFISASPEGLARACELWQRVCPHAPSRLDGAGSDACAVLMQRCESRPIRDVST